MYRRDFLASALYLRVIRQEHDFDLILKRGVVVDGSGEPPRVAVNGRVVFEKGERTEELPGRVLRGRLDPQK